MRKIWNITLQEWLDHALSDKYSQIIFFLNSNCNESSQNSQNSQNSTTVQNLWKKQFAVKKKKYTHLLTPAVLIGPIKHLCSVTWYMNFAGITFLFLFFSLLIKLCEPSKKQ